MTFPPEDGVPTIARRLGTAPRDWEGLECAEMNDCPDVFELSSGDYAVIGLDVSESLVLPSDAGHSATERVVMVPRDVLMAAFRDLSRGL